MEEINLKIKIQRDKRMCGVFNTSAYNRDSAVRTIRHIALCRLKGRDSVMLQMYVDYITFQEIGAKYRISKQCAKKYVDKLLYFCKSYIEVFDKVKESNAKGVSISDCVLNEIKTLSDVGFTNGQIAKLRRADVITLDDLLKADTFELYNTRSIGVGVINKVLEIKKKYGVV